MSAPRAFTVREAARHLTISESTAWNLIRDGRIKVIKLGRRTVVPEQEIARLLSADAS